MSQLPEYAARLRKMPVNMPRSKARRSFIDYLPVVSFTPSLYARNYALHLLRLVREPLDERALRAHEGGAGAVRPIEIQERHPGRVQERLSGDERRVLAVRTPDPPSGRLILVTFRPLHRGAEASLESLADTCHAT